MSSIFEEKSPVETIIGAGLYIIPQGKFAKVTLIEGGGALFVNGIELFPAGATQLAVNYGETRTGAQVTYVTAHTVASDGFFSGVLNFDSYYYYNGSKNRYCNRPNYGSYIGLFLNNTEMFKSGCSAIGSTNFGFDVQAGDLIKVMFDLAGIGTPTGIASFSNAAISEPVSKPITGNAILKEGDTIEGGKYVISLYEV